MRLAARARMFVASRTALVTVPRMSVPATAVTLAPPVAIAISIAIAIAIAAMVTLLGTTAVAVIAIAARLD